MTPRPVRTLTALLFLGAALGAGPATATAAEPAPTIGAPDAVTTLSTQERRLKVDVRIEKFVVTRAGLRALGSATADVGARASRKKVVFKVAKSANCSVLSLSLEDLKLQLLGLNLDTSAINLRITGDRGRSLGKLFCRLSESLRIGGTATAAAASLNQRIAGRPLHAIRIAAALTPSTLAAPPTDATGATLVQSPAAGTCQVLDLILGPLRLDLLGLIVDLYGADRSKPVQVTVTANPAQGVLGATFCRLANGQAAA